MQDYEEITWWHSIDLGDGTVTPGQKSAQALEDEFNALGLTDEVLNAKRVLDVGCNDGYMSLACERRGATVVGIDGIFRDGLKYVLNRLRPRMKFYCMDMLSPSFFELGRFDVILYLGVLYHSAYPFEQILRLASACNPGALVFVESEYYNIENFEDQATIIYNYDGGVTPDLTTPAIPSIRWIQGTLARVGFANVSVMRQTRGGYGSNNRGRVIVRGEYNGGMASSPMLYAAEQAMMTPLVTSRVSQRDASIPGS